MNANAKSVAQSRPQVHTFRADHLGSFLRPGALLDARDHYFKARDISAEQLRAAEDAAIRDVVKFQEKLGFKVITDGEFRRGSWHGDFLTRLGGVVEQGGRLKIAGPIRHLQAIQLRDFQFLKSATPCVVKVPIPSPTMLHGRDGAARSVYPDLEEFFDDVAAAYRVEIASLAAAGCSYVQLDDTNLARLCDGAQREAARARGHDPDRLPYLYARLVNDSLRDRPENMTIGMHLCRGSLRSRAADGGYEPIAEALFNEFDVDAYLLEFDDARCGDFAPLRHLPKGKLVVMGLVTTKLGELESKDDLKRRIDEAARYMPLGQMCLSPQCGFSSTVHGNQVEVEQQAAKCRLVIETAREVWGAD
ncbi:MAG TPA: 5-methyltetrahydropteroyltriglutamate--homocysteine S-methyltransferase [Steroidobacteraceae bacterium]|jgi:5-methyltetrahydropteroyltriglutamate--homocysteine methyltransferase|nr:5-methyltetrahydropteroyltriglutamate--homocysteine S-methyltransferase [Steroidobacteraceae bacterium]